MYVGHFLLAFALAGSVAHAAGWSRERVLAVALAAGGFGLVPDVDLAYTLYVVVREGPTNVFPTTQYVWTESWVVHRLLTHSLVVGTIGVALAAGVASTLARGERSGDAPLGRRRTLGAALAVLALGGLAAVALSPRASDAGLAVVTLSLYAVAVVVVATLATRRAGFAPRSVAAAAGAGLLTHPFGDVFMGTPPAFGYPFTGQTGEAVRIVADPTVNLLALFALEVALAWWALAVVARTHDRSLVDLVRPRATLGAGYAGAVLFVPPPTLDLAYQFAIGVILTGVVVGAGPLAAPTAGATDATRSRPPVPRRLAAAGTALAATTLGLAAYLLAYLAL